MKIKDKHCICKEWKKKYLKAIWDIGITKHEVITAQNRGVRCPFCDKKLVEIERKAWIGIEFPPVFVDMPKDLTPQWSYSSQSYWITLEEFKRMLKESK